MKKDIIIPTEFLDKEQQKLMQDVMAMYPQVPSGMTPYQIEQFVLGVPDHPTWYSVYYQVLRESWVRFTVVVDTINQIQEAQIKNELLEAQCEKLYEEKNDFYHIKAKLFQHRIKVSKQHIVIQLRELEHTFGEMKVFMKVQMLAIEKMKGQIPEHGDDKEERIKWYLKFLLQKQPMRTSLVTGNMNDSQQLMDQSLKDQLLEDRSLSRDFELLLNPKYEKDK